MLSQLVTIQNEIDRVLGAPKLSPDDRVKIVNLLHSRFEHIYKVLKYDGLAPLPPPAAGVLPIAAQAIPAAAGVPAGVGGMPAAFIPVPLVAPPQIQLAPFQTVDAGAAAPDDAAGPIAEEDAHELDAALGGEPRGTVGQEQPSAQGSETESAVVWPTKQEMGITKNMETKYKQFTTKLSRLGIRP